MSEHAWVHENLAAYVTGGLDAAEGERVEAHAAECESCTAALRDARALDQGMDALFAAARPEPALEDRMIQALRAAPGRAWFGSRWNRKLVWGAAATVALGATGAAVSQFTHPNALRFPGMVGMEVRNNLKPIAPGAIDNSLSMTNATLMDIDQDGSIDLFYPPAMALEVQDQSRI